MAVREEASVSTIRIAVIAGSLGCAFAWTAAAHPVPPSPAPAKVSAPSGLFGEWILEADDENPGLQPPEERLTLTPDGKWKMSAAGGPTEGRYRVQGEEILLLTEVEGNTRAQRRGFKLDQEGLHLANRGQGYAHYKRAK
jgi:hypothetical protein